MRRYQFLFFAILVVLLVSCLDSGGSSGSGQSNAPSEPAGQAAPSPLERIMAAQNLSQAIEIASPDMTDTSDAVSPGAVELASWASAHLKWPELSRLPATRYALVMKDPGRERGKRITVYGSIVEITAEDTRVGKIYEGGMLDSNFNVYRFIAVGSTGDLVQQSEASFTGVVIGRQDYSNSAGGMSHAVYLVGMFNLPENLRR